MSSDLQNNYPKMFYTFANLLDFKISKLKSTISFEGLPLNEYR